MTSAKKIGFMLIMLLVIGMLAAACGGTKQEENKGEAAGGEQAVEAGASANSGQAEGQEQDGAEGGSDTAASNDAVRTIEHTMGTTEVKGTPLKVVTLFQSATDAALMLGVKPTGAVESWIEQPWYEYIRGQMDGVVNLGSENQPDLEQIVALKPDLIIATKSRHEKIYDQLKAIAPTVMDEEVYFWKDTLKLTANALNKQDKEAEFLQEWDRKVADFKTQMGDRLTNTEAAVVDFRTDHVRIVYTGFAALVMDELGIPRPENQKGEEWGVKLTTKENIPQMNADIIFDQTSTSRDDGRLDLRASWQEHPLWSSLRAVQNNKVYEVDTAVWNNGSGPIAATLMLEDLYEFLELQK